MSGMESDPRLFVSAIVEALHGRFDAGTLGVDGLSLLCKDYLTAPITDAKLEELLAAGGVNCEALTRRRKKPSSALLLVGCIVNAARQRSSDLAMLGIAANRKNWAKVPRWCCMVETPLCGRKSGDVWDPEDWPCSHLPCTCAVHWVR